MKVILQMSHRPIRTSKRPARLQECVTGLEPKRKTQQSTTLLLLQESPLSLPQESTQSLPVESAPTLPPESARPLPPDPSQTIPPDSLQNIQTSTNEPKLRKRSECVGALAKEGFSVHPNNALKYICVCGVIVTISSKSRSNLIRHLNTQCQLLRSHFLEISGKKFLSLDEKISQFQAVVQEQRDLAERRRQSLLTKQKTIPDLLAKMLGRDLPQTSYAGDLILTEDEYHTFHLIVGVIDGQSFAQMSSAGLQAKMVFDKRKLVCSETYRTKYLEAAYHFANFVFKKTHHYLLPSTEPINSQLHQPFISVATDGWSSRYNSRSVSIVLSSIDWDKGVLNTKLAGMRPLSDAHTCLNLSTLYCEVLESLLTQVPRIASATTDNAANEAGAGWSIADERTPCFSHTIQLWIHSFLGKEEIKKHTKFPLKLTSKLAEYECSWRIYYSLGSDLDPPKRPPTFVKTRWWSEIRPLIYYIQNEPLLQQLIKTPSYDGKWITKMVKMGLETRPDTSSIRIITTFLTKGILYQHFFFTIC